MTLDDIILIARNRLAYLHQHRGYAFDRGDIDAVNLLDQEITTTQTTLAQLLSLQPL